jgi:hypothetical protein
MGIEAKCRRRIAPSPASGSTGDPMTREGKRHGVRLALLMGLEAAALLLMGAPVAAVGLTITSGDGVGLALRADGSVAGMQLGSRQLSMVGGGGFSFRNVGGMPNLLPNAGFESDRDGDGVPDGWTVRNSPVPTISTTVARSGLRSVRLHRDTLGDTGLLRIDLPVKRLTEYTISAWMRSDAIQPTAPPGLTNTAKSPVRVLVQQWAGDAVLTNGYLYGYTDTAGWNRQSLGVRTLIDTTTLRLSIKLMAGRGTAWYDDLRVAELFRPASVPIRGTVTRAADGSLTQHAALPGQQLTLDARYKASSDRITIDGTIRSTSRADVPLELSYTLPFGAVGWRWADYARRSKAIVTGRSYAYDTRWHIQSMSRYPWSTLGDARSSLSIGIPMSMPRIARVRYDPKGLTISFDIGMSRHATNLGNAATFRFVLFTSDPAWGFRAATAKYYALYPDDFVRRTDPAREGGWTQRKYLGRWANRMADFGLGMDMLGLDTDAYLLEADNAEGIYPTAYNHQWGYKFDLATNGAIPTYQEAIRLLHARANGPRDTEEERRTADKAKAAIVSAARDYNGRLVYELYIERFLQYYENLDPIVAARIDAARAGHDFQVLSAIAQAAAVDGTLDAIHFDSTSGMRRWGAQDDYSRRHWAAALEPLTFSYDSGLVADRISFTDYGQIVREADYLHGRGMILTANFNGSEARAGAWFGANKIDYFGIEQGLTEKTGANDRYVTQDGFAMYKRTLAHDRPVTTFDTLIGQGLLSTAEVERRLRVNLFYGIYPGFGGSALTEKVHRLYLHYVPIFRAIDAAGWEPVTSARATDPRVWLERYGSLASGPLYVAVRNETNVARRYTVHVDLLGAGGPVSGLVGRELVRDSPVAIAVGSEGQTATFRGTIGARGTHVVRLTRAP